MALNNNISRTSLLFGSVTFDPNGPIYFSDTIGKVVDNYSYVLKSIVIPITLYKEFSYNKLRPYVSIGIYNKYYLKKDISLNRKTYEDGKDVVEENLKISFPDHLFGTRAGLGCRYLINMNYSVSAGFNYEFCSGKRNDDNYIGENVKRFLFDLVFIF